MANTSDFVNLPGTTKEMRDRLITAFDALTNWRDEIQTANERCLGNVLEQTSEVARSMGWPDEAVKATRQYLQNASKSQTQLIDQLMDGWKQQLKSPIAPMAVPRGLAGPTPGMQALGAFAPWTIWLQAAEMWQRTWMPDVSRGWDTRSH
jgi:hypothetical protein